MEKTIISIAAVIISIFVLWLMYELIKGIQKSKKDHLSYLKYGDEVIWLENRTRTIDAVVLSQVRNQVRIRTKDDGKVWLVPRDECILKLPGQSNEDAMASHHKIV